MTVESWGSAQRVRREVLPLMVVSLTETQRLGENFTREVNRRSGQNVWSCYQCGKCTGGCPMAFAMDYGPRGVMRLLQLGMKEEALNNKTIWFCAGCLACSTRCPRDIDIYRVMDAVRVIARKENIKPQVTHIPLFAVVDEIQPAGRGGDGQ